MRIASSNANPDTNPNANGNPNSYCNSYNFTSSSYPCTCTHGHTDGYHCASGCGYSCAHTYGYTYSRFLGYFRFFNRTGKIGVLCREGTP